jgi:microcystin degradation protein MlrC
MPRIAVAGLFHESNTFVAGRTHLSDFIVHRGRAMRDALAGTQTVCGGVLCAIPDAVPVLHAYATPAGPVDPTAYDSLVSELCARLADVGRVDGVVLELHGAMVAAGMGAVDGETSRRVRSTIGATPLAIVLDPHTNLASGVVESADVVLAYRTNPHEDMAATGERAAETLKRVIDGTLKPRVACVRVPVTAPAIAQATADKPLRDILAAARELELSSRCVAVSVIFGFAYADVPEQSMAVIAITDGDDDAAAAAANEIASVIWGCRTAFGRELASPAESAEIAANSRGPTALANIGDNVGGGAPGNSTVLAAQLLCRGVPAATTICDPAVVAWCEQAGVGHDIELEVGDPPMRISGRVVRMADGRYVNDGPLSRGVEFNMGRVAVVAAGSLQIVFQSRAVMANDQNMLRSCGVDVGSLRAVDLKGAAAIRAGWATMVERFVDVDTPGPTSADIQNLGLRNVPRPLWPLDGQMAWP